VLVKEHSKTMEGQDTYAGQKRQDFVSASLWVKKTAISLLLPSWDFFLPQFTMLLLLNVQETVLAPNFFSSYNLSFHQTGKLPCLLHL